LPHAKSLRAIGQSLESLGVVVAFVMEKNGHNYIVRSDVLRDVAKVNLKTDLSEKVWEVTGGGTKASRLVRNDGSLSYDPPYVSWLDAQGRKRRRRRFSAQVTGTMKVSQLLRAVGKHLDRVEPHVFSIHWSKDGVLLDYELADGQTMREILTFAKLRELTLRSRFRRARRK
jgi:hypothetical protein